MTITESRASRRVSFELEFLKPFKVTNAAEFTFEPEADHTAVTWSMSGKSKFMCKVIGLFMNMDKCIGGEFEKSLANLKGLAEAEARSPEAVHLVGATR